eukprot:9481796-Pyramimonas_sp.AAC.1
MPVLEFSVSLKGRQPHEITAAIKRIAQHASLWGEVDALYLGSADVLQCFDHVAIAIARGALAPRMSTGADPCNAWPSR